MLKNKEIKKLLFFEIVLFCIFVGVLFINNHTIYQEYQKRIIHNNNYILGTILEKHPELESELIETILKNSDSLSYHNILEKYGLDSYENVDQMIDMDALQNKIFYNTIIYLLIFIILFILLFYFFVRRQYKKVRDITAYMNSILSGNYALDIRSYEEGDISNLKNDVYKVTVKLKTMSDQSMEDKKYLESTLSDISHQIRTPLTSMYVINDLLSNEEIDPILKKEFLLKNRNQLERIEWLVTSLLKLSRLESGTIVLKREKVEVKKLLEKAVEPITIPMELKEIRLKMNCSSNLFISADFNWTTEAIINIVKNAYEHTPVGGTVTIEASDNPIYTEIMIRDTGEGIDRKDISHVFERFYKGKHNKESIGIGLNMSKKIINLQKGDIEVESSLGNYTIFRIKFYKNIV